MKTYLIEYKCKTPPSFIEVIDSNFDEVAEWYAERESNSNGRIPGDFDIYRVMRNTSGELYLASMDWEPIKA